MNRLVRTFVIWTGLLGSAGAVALPIELNYDGIKWSWTSDDVGQSSGSIVLSFDATGSSLPGTTAYLHSFLLKGADGYGSFKVASASATSPQETWTWFNGELDANDCKSNGNASSMCFKGTPALNITDTGSLDFQINFVLSAGVLTEALHLKALWVETNEAVCTQNGNSSQRNGNSSQKNGNSPHKTGDSAQTCGFAKVGDLISEDFLRTPDEPEEPDDPENPVPVPGTLVLLGLGLLGLGRSRQRRPRA